MDSVYYTVRQIEDALKPVLCPISGGGGSIPIPPLIELIAQYAVRRAGLVSLRAVGSGKSFSGPIGLVRVPLQLKQPASNKSETKNPATAVAGDAKASSATISESIVFVSYSDNKICQLRLSDSPSITRILCESRYRYDTSSDN